jgi:hypothetical protein
MKRAISVERLYTLAEYQNIKFINTLSEIPEELSNNASVVGKLFLQQYLSCDIAYLEYQKMRAHVAKEKVEDVIGYLKEQRELTMADLYEEIKAVGESKEITNNKEN